MTVKGHAVVSGSTLGTNTVVHKMMEDGSVKFGVQKQANAMVSGSLTVTGSTLLSASSGLALTVSGSASFDTVIDGQVNSLSNHNLSALADVSSSVDSPNVSDVLSYDGSKWIPQPAAGGGNVSNTGTPLDNQIPVWTGATVLEGVPELTYDGTTLAVTGNLQLSGDISASLLELKQTASVAHSEGTMYYDINEHTLTVMNDVSDVRHQLGQEGFIRVKNETGVTITNGSVVYISGSDVGVEGRPTIGLALASDQLTANVIGFATHDIGDNSYGYVTYWGKINDVDTSLYAPGAPLYLSDTVAGAFTSSAPTAGNYEVRLGSVVESSATTGSILAQINADLGAFAGEADALVENVRKGSPGTVSAGQVVYLSGYNNGQQVEEVELAANNSSATMPAYGVARDSFNQNTNGSVVVVGRLAGLNTSAWSVGDGLYVSSVAGQLTNVKPTGSASLIQRVGVVLRSNTVNGIIEVLGANRTNDLPNIVSGSVWLGDADDVPIARGRSGIDDTALHDNQAGEISAITAKGTPVADDYLIIEDSADSNNKKSIRLGSLTGSAGLVAHGFADVVYHTASTLAEVNTLISDATLDTNTAERPAAAHGFADVVRHTASTLAEVNTLISDATLIDTTDSRLSDDRDPNLHGLGNASRHSASTLAELNALISDATLDDVSGNRTDADAIHDNVASEISAITAKGTPVANDYLLIEDSADSNNKKSIRLGSLTGSAGLTAHGFADVVYHTASTLAEVNTLITDATLDSTSSSRPPNGFATGDLTASYPNPAVAAITTLSGSGTRLEIGNIPDGFNLVRSGTTIIGTSGSAPGAHAASHISGGSDQIDGDRLNIDYVSTNYTRTTAPSEVTNVEQLTAHLAGIDNALGAGIVPHGFADVVNHTASTLAEVNNLISDAELDSTGSARPAQPHGFADVVRHTSSTLAEVNTLISDATLDTNTAERPAAAHGFADVVRHTSSTLAEVNTLISDATLDTNTASRPAQTHGFADVLRHSSSALAEVNTLISDATLIDTADSRLSDDRDPNLHGLGNASRHSASTLAELNALVSDATLDTNTAERPAAAHGFADVVRHTSSTLTEVNTLISDATLIDTGDSRLSDDRDPNLHGLGNAARHSSSTLAELNALISDATLDTNTAERPAASHGFADVVRHTASTLAEVNTLISDATLYEWENDLGGTQINANNVPDGADATAIHDNVSGEIAAITQKTAPVANDILLIEDSAATNAKKRVLWGTITGSGGGLSAHGFADVVYHTASTLAEVNSLITDATLDSTSSSRPPNGFATGDLTGSYPNPAVAAITTLSGSGTRLEIADITAGETLVRVGNTITSQAAGAPGAHAATHIHSGSDEINGDLLDIDYVPTNYTRDTSGPLVTSVEELTAHLAGIDNQLSGTTRKDYGTRATDPSTPTPAEGDKYYNTDLEMDMRYDGSRSKWLSVEASTLTFGKSGNGAAGAYFNGPDGVTYSSTEGLPAFHSGTVVSIGYTRTDTDAAVFQVTADGTEVAFISSSATVGTNTAADGDFSPNQVLGVLNKTGGNTVSNAMGWVKIKWRI